MRISLSARAVRDKREQAFTLAELIVVLLVVALLAIVMLPALARSGDYGGRSICVNNLRQMGRAVGMYANDNTDYLPYPNWDSPRDRVGFLHRSVVRHRISASRHTLLIRS